MRGRLTGMLASALVLPGAVVFSFRIYQDMAVLQEERAEKIVLENQIIQMQGSIYGYAGSYGFCGCSL